jgi:TonB-dependent starch-binding outer membrane protein SusC
MKKITDLFGNVKIPGLKKLLRFMKLTVLFILISVGCVLAGKTYSQTKTLTLHMENTTVKKVLAEIESQSEFRIMYSGKFVDVDREVSLDVKNQKIESVLNTLFAGTDVSYTVKDRFIVLITPELMYESTLAVIQQQRSVSGTVTDESDEPLPGVTVVVKGTSQGRVTNADGNYSITNIPEDATLVFSFVGMRTKEVVVGSQTNIDVKMEVDAIGIEEVVAIGYGTVRKSDLTGSVQHVDASLFENQTSTNMLEFLSGTVAGLNVNQGTSASGGGSMEIRGPTSLKADNNPLIVLDGVIYNGNIGDINPNDIESVDILKDASSAAIYGSRSASGVIIITTKRGQTSSPMINIVSKIGVTGVTKHMYPRSPEQHLTMRGDYLAQINPNKPSHYYSDPNKLPEGLSIEEWKNFDVTPSDDVIQMWLNRIALQPLEADNYRSGKIINWYDDAYRNGIRQDYDLSLSGSTPSLRYYFSIGYVNNEGVVLGDDYQNIRSRINIDADLTDFLNVGVNVQFADMDQSSQAISLGSLMAASPYGNKYEEDGKTLKFYPHDDPFNTNPFVYYQNSDKMNVIQNLFATLYSEIKLPFGFSYRISFLNRYNWTKDYYFDPITTPNGFNKQGDGYRNDNSSYEWQVDNILNWQKTFANIHKFYATFLINAEKFQSWRSFQENSQFAPSDALSFHALQAGINPSLNNNDTYSTANALMARINYSLLDKYLFTLTWRRDGYSAFGQKNPYAEFPSAAFGWRISEESFFNIDWIDNLKFRLSWGVNGNRAIGMYEALARLGTEKYIYGTTLATGVYSTSMANSDLRWEQTKALNFGVDFGIFRNVIHGSVDYYDMTTNDLLLDRSLPSIIGYTSVASNLGELGNKGFELTLNTTNINKADFRWNSNLVFSFNRNKIKHLYGDMNDVLDDEGNVIGQKEADDLGNQWFIGEAIDRIWDYKILGIWQLEEAEQAAIYGRQPGDVKLLDVNDDGVLSPMDDKIFQGYRRPRFRIGLRNDLIVFKNFEISAFLRADLGFYQANNLPLNDGHPSHYDRFNNMYSPYWTKEKPTNDYGRLGSNNSSPNVTRWENSSFLRLQDLSVAYNVPKAKLSKYKIQNLKIFLNLRNSLTFTGWSHYDPESGTEMMPKISSIGISASL